MKTNFIILLCCVAYALGDEVSDAINNVVNNHSYRYVTFTLNDSGTALLVERKGDKSESLEEFVNKLPKAEPCYVLYDFEYEFDGSNKQCFMAIYWAPENLKIKRKIQYASAIKVFKLALKDVTELRDKYANDVDDLDLDALIPVAEQM